MILWPFRPQCHIIQQQLLMQLGSLKQNTPKLLLGVVKDSGQTYGDKFQKFADQIYRTFQRISRVYFGKVIPDKIRLPLAILAAILLMKNLKMRNQDYSAIGFLDTCKPKLKEIAPQLKEQRLLNLMKERIAAQGPMDRIITGEKAQIWAGQLAELMNAVAQVKGKQATNYNEDQMKRISNFFGQRVFLVNYDDNKSPLTDKTLSHKSVYLLKAKDLFFVMFKEQDIEQIDRGVVTHEELAILFQIQNKLERVNGKPIQGKAPQVKSPSKGAKLTSTTGPTKSQVILRLKPSVLFPDDVKCTHCSKISSQFSAIFWNYSYFCLKCVMNPKVDTSGIPSSIIQKFLKNQKVETKEYLMVCAECGSDTTIGNYRPWQKPRSYKCKACVKEICVEHERMIGECFCHCQSCDKKTLSIQATCTKVCLSCRMRFCQVCKQKEKRDCKCICKECGKNKEISHEECTPRCHWCESKEVVLFTCRCERKLCGVCYFSSMDHNSAICGNHPHPM